MTKVHIEWFHSMPAAVAALSRHAMGHHRMRLHTLCMRMELYVSHATWGTLSRYCQIHLFDVFSHMSITWQKHLHVHQVMYSQPWVGKIWPVLPNRHHRQALFTAVRALEQHMQLLLAQCNQTRLREYVDALVHEVGTQALCSPLGCAMTGRDDPSSVPSNETQQLEKYSVVDALSADAVVDAPAPGASAFTAVDQANGAATDTPESIQQSCCPTTRTPTPPDSATIVALAVACSLASSDSARCMSALFPWPLYLIATRDSFAVQLVELQDKVCYGVLWCAVLCAPDQTAATQLMYVTNVLVSILQVNTGASTYLRTRFYFPEDQAPADYAEVNILHVAHVPRA